MLDASSPAPEQHQDCSFAQKVIRASFTGLLVAGLVGSIYSVACWYIPILYLNVLFPLGVAWLIGWVVAARSIARVIQSRKTVWCMALVAGLTAVYVAWGTSAFIRIPGIGIQAYRPDLLVAFWQDLYRFDQIDLMLDGRNTEIKSGGLIFVWVIEALAIIAGSMVVANLHYRIMAPPACELCSAWQTKRHGILRLLLADESEEFVDAFVDKVNRRELDFLDEFAIGSLDDDPHLRVDASWCPQCGESCTISVAFVTYSSEPGEVELLKDFSVSAERLGDIHARSMAEKEDPRSDGENHGS